MRLYSSRSRPGAPTVDIDLYAPPALEDSRALFARIRDAGPVVWLPRHRMYAMGRFEDVRAALRDGDAFLSGQGVAANWVTNTLGTRAFTTTLFTDGALHDTQRRLMRAKLSAPALREIQSHIEQRATDTVERLATGAPFDVVRDFSSVLPTNIVAELVGLRVEHAQLLRWAAANFDALGPVNARSIAAAPVSLGLIAYASRLERSQVVPGSWADSVFDARDAGEITTRQARGLIIDFVTPSLDTTILAATHQLRLLSQVPDAWDALREDPTRISAAVVENVRIGSPVRCFTRSLARDYDIGSATLPRGARVAVLFGSANHDEREFPDPERFDLARANAARQLGWGNGAHACAGLHLAKLELQALLNAMVPRVRRIETWDPVRLRNNTLQGYAALRGRFVPA